ncbi:PrgI family protein [Patescibacteria group bacterium]|nr:PrgI family protein [Patescibacteria group bacterium]
MQFKVPQFIELEDKIVGPLTIKQFLFLAGGGALLFVLWLVLALGAFIVVAIPIGGIAMALAFYRPNGQPFIFLVISFFNYLFKPKLYLWRKKR